MQHEPTQAQTIEEMKAWCLDNYANGADTMAECWGTSDYADLFIDHNGQALTTAEAWDLLKQLAGVYEERQADARNSAF